MEKLKSSITKIVWKLRGYNSRLYWESRYNKGGNSGDGSYSQLAKFKAEFINKFIKQSAINSVVEIGCGDGNQAKMFKCPKYKGYDISHKAIEICRALKLPEDIYSFDIIESDNVFTCDLALSLDVIYHLVEDDIFESYMRLLFGRADKYVIIYSSNLDLKKTNIIEYPHEKHRNFTSWVEKNISGFKLEKIERNKYPYCPKKKEGSLADFYVYKKIEN